MTAVSPSVQTATPGLVLRVDHAGVIDIVVWRELDLAAPLVPGSSLADIVEPSDREQVERFIEAMTTHQLTYDWEIPVPLGRGAVPLRFAGCEFGAGFVVLVSPLHEEQERLRLEERRHGEALALAQETLRDRNAALESALEEVKTLRGLIPICAQCKDIRDERDAWVRLEEFLQSHSDAQFTHGLCPPCARAFADEGARNAAQRDAAEREGRYPS